MVVSVVVRKLKSFLFIIITAFKRALCCFRRRRRNSSDFTPLEQVDIVSSPVENTDYQSWNTWNDEFKSENQKPSSIQEHIEYYRQQTIAARQVQEEESETPEYFFDDMVPKITKQTKVLINVNKDQDVASNRLSLVPENTIISQELEEWNENSGWEEQTLDYDAREALKENRKLARQKKKEKLVKPILGARVGS